MKTLLVVISAAAAAAGLSGCTAVQRTDTPYARALNLGGGQSVTVIEDPVGKVTCYLPIGNGIFCLPNTQVAR
jgi:hypothetical protein